MKWALLILVTLPFALIVFSVVSFQIEQRRMRNVARTFACTTCGTLLGDESIAIAAALWQRHMETFRERFPDRKPRLAHTLHAACRQCGARFEYDFKARTFRAVEIVLLFEQD